jgi:uncharacterized phage protein (TIGR02216 family)
VMPWVEYFNMGVCGLGLRPDDFYKLTLKEFWSLYDFKFGHVQEKITRDDLKDMMKWSPDK